MYSQYYLCGHDLLSVFYSIECRAEELAAPYYLFLKKGYLIDVVSIAGGKVPIDPLSVAPPYDKISIIKHFLADGAIFSRSLQAGQCHAVAGWYLVQGKSHLFK